MFGLLLVGLVFQRNRRRDLQTPELHWIDDETVAVACIQFRNANNDESEAVKRLSLQIKRCLAP